MHYMKYGMLLIVLAILAGVLSCGRSGAPAPTPQVKILPKSGCVYHGAFLGEDTITSSSIDAFESMAGTRLDIVLKFLAFSQMGVTGGGFPLAEANTVSANGSVIFIKLEPWSWGGKGDLSFSLEKIIAGNFDASIAEFAKAAAAFGKPLFVCFGHEMNADWYPWGGKPELYKQAYRRVHGIMTTHADNLTWVWNPDVGGDDLSLYYPGEAYVDWVAADGYNTEDYGESWKTAQQIFNAAVTDLEYFGKPLMIGETACDANSENDEAVLKPQWLYSAVEWIVGRKKAGSSDNLIKAFVYFNFDKEEEGQMKKWAISRAEAKAKYKQALTDNSAYFKGIDP